MALGAQCWCLISVQDPPTQGHHQQIWVVVLKQNLKDEGFRSSVAALHRGSVGCCTSNSTGGALRSSVAISNSIQSKKGELRSE